MSPHIFFGFLAKVDHYLSAWLKKSVRGNILGANVLNQGARKIDPRDERFHKSLVTRIEGHPGSPRMCRTLLSVELYHDPFIFQLHKAISDLCE